MAGKPVKYGKKRSLSSADDGLLARLSDGFGISQDEYDQVAYDLPPDEIAQALVRRWLWTEDARTLRSNCARAARVRPRCARWPARFCRASGGITPRMR